QVDKNNRVWVATDNGFFGIDVQSDGQISGGVGPFVKNKVVFDILIDSNEIFVATSNGVYNFLDILHPKQRHHLNIENEEDCLMIEFMDDKRNKIVCYSSSSYYKIGLNYEITKLPYDIGISFHSYLNPESATLIVPSVTNLAITENGAKIKNMLDINCFDIVKNGNNYILGTLYDGIYILDEKFEIIKKISSDKISPAIRRIFIDEESNYWIGTDGGGLYLVTKNSFKSYTTDNGLPDNIIWSVKSDTNNQTTYVGTYNGIVEISDTGVQYHDFNKELSNLSINAIEIDNNGGLFIGTDLYLDYVSPDRKTVKQFNQSEMSLSKSAIIHTLKFDNEENLWVGTDYHPNILKYSFDGNWTPYDFGKNFDEDIVKDIEFDSSGDMWIASDNYIARKNNNFWDSFYLNGIKIYDFEILENGEIIIGSDEGVWQLFGNEFIRPQTNVDSLFTVYFVKEDFQNNIWYGTDNGVICEKSNGEFHYFTQKHGLIGNETNARAVAIDHKGSVWIGTIDGVSQYLGTEEESDVSPKVYIHSLSTKSQKYIDFSESIKFSESPSIFNFDYGSVLLNRSDPIEYGIRLLGLEDEWRWTESDEAVYGSLKGGQYKFQVVGRLSPKNQSEIVEISFSISLNIFESPFFYFGLLILTILLTWHFVLLFRKRQDEKLKRKVEFYFFREKFCIRVLGNILSSTIIQSNKIRSLFELIVLYSLIEEKGIEQTIVMKQFWPTGTSAQKKNRRNVAISKIRSVFDKKKHGQVISINDGYYILDLDSNFVYCDVLDFIKCFKLGEKFVKQQSISRAVEFYQKAVILHGSSGLLIESDNPLILTYRREFLQNAKIAASYILSHEKEISNKDTIDLCYKIDKLQVIKSQSYLRK
ncbi:MAG: hypothetical protein ISS11_06765, partial [Candidatus Marinimicrobia bacterium]|nr:hypothetical protein [Candidatus Neomarinimicrobiota bacterium]